MCGGAHLKAVQTLLVVVARRAPGQSLCSSGRQGERALASWGRGAVVTAWGSVSTTTAWQGECAGHLRPVARARDRGAAIAIQAEILDGLFKNWLLRPKRKKPSSPFLLFAPLLTALALWGRLGGTMLAWSSTQWGRVLGHVPAAPQGRFFGCSSTAELLLSKSTTLFLPFYFFFLPFYFFFTLDRG